ncbi:cytochrome P450 [Streptomyces sp. G5(2025)]|uniref:cytochrome P450 n=1 Tax=Streptomyces sp. G5(2025) TaxID=3406628 RepID=UPI003C29AA92
MADQNVQSAATPNSPETAADIPDYPFERPSALEPCPHYAKMRKTAPVGQVRMPSGDLAHLVTSYEDVRTVLSDPRFSRNATTRPGAPRLGPAPQNFPSLLNMDAPEHTRVRKLVSREFTARRVNQLRPRIQEHTDRLLDAMEEAGPPTDLISALAFPLPVTIICELLGVPFEDRERFAGWSAAFLATAGLPADQVLASQIALRDYLAGLVAAKRANPGTDLLSALVAIHDTDDGRLSEPELIFLGISMLVAGHETTVNQIGNSVLALLTHPEQLAAVRRAPEHLGRATEEMLRMYPPGDEGLLRIALEDVELAGTLIPAGSAVLPSLGSANRDVCQFADADSFDVSRENNAHLSFGQGAHYCLGSGLARAELEIALGTLLKRFPGLRLAVPEEELPRPSGRLVHGVSELPVAW